eukprot:gnl/Dysnectes_brevis/1476_a1670_3440.p1 GENE.gnl/Dysnectes_brevis/1476_a1670_3440~~gnl/Dysnectes_brevis/1476_a1670_3440.p1  ORF type:complete len:244 (+),score=70.47 gnl/Dysnectes_brevis/1476_a1670_3440:839-1570(+)
MSQSIVTQVAKGSSESKKQKTKSRCCLFSCCASSKDTQRAAVDDSITVMTPQVQQTQLTPDATPILPKQLQQHQGRKLMVLDLDETLVHSSFKPEAGADFVLSLTVESEVHSIYVRKRPFVDEFLQKAARHWELCVFTASLPVYADAVMDRLDPHGLVTHRLYRDSCTYHMGVFVKDLSRLGRPLESIIILDNFAASYIFQPTNAVPVDAFYDDPADTHLRDLMPLLDALVEVDDVRKILGNR